MTLNTFNAHQRRGPVPDTHCVPGDDELIDQVGFSLALLDSCNPRTLVFDRVLEPANEWWKRASPGSLDSHMQRLVLPWPHFNFANPVDEGIVRDAAQHIFDIISDSGLDRASYWMNSILDHLLNEFVDKETSPDMWYWAEPRDMVNEDVLRHEPIRWAYRFQRLNTHIFCADLEAPTFTPSSVAFLLFSVAKHFAEQARLLHRLVHREWRPPSATRLADGRPYEWLPICRYDGPYTDVRQDGPWFYAWFWGTICVKAPVDALSNNLREAEARRAEEADKPDLGEHARPITLPRRAANWNPAIDEEVR